MLPLALLAGGCGGKKKGGGGSDDGASDEPVRGGSVTYALEAESTDGWCLPESQLAISGIMVARTIFDTLTAPNSEGEYVPYLAEAVEPNDDYTTWTITLREGVKFHNGEDLTAEVVRNNIDAYRGIVGSSQVAEPVRYEGRSPLLFTFVLSNIDNVEVTGDLEVTVTTVVPWVGFPAFLHSSGRLGIIAQEQLDDQETCDSKLIGTGPFALESWDPDQELVAVANEDYWQEAPDGEPYPYLDEIHFRPIVDSEQRVNTLETGNVDLIHVSAAQDMNTIEGSVEDGDLRARQSEEFAEVTYVQMNNSKAPFDDDRIRRAMALAVDRTRYTEEINLGRFTMASGPFAPGAIGHLEDAGFPTEPDLEESRRLIAEYESENGPIRPLSYQATPGAVTQQVAIFVQQTMNEVGLEVELSTVQQDELIDNAISGEYDIQGFRNFPGGDPDELYVWWYGGSPVNFGRFNDPELNALLDQGRSEPDPDARREIYENVNRIFGEKQYLLWSNWTTWEIAAQPTVGGYTLETLPKLPNGDDPFPGLATGHPVHGLWVESS